MCVACVHSHAPRMQAAYAQGDLYYYPARPRFCDVTPMINKWSRVCQNRTSDAWAGTSAATTAMLATNRTLMSARPQATADRAGRLLTGAGSQQRPSRTRASHPRRVRVKSPGRGGYGLATATTSRTFSDPRRKRTAAAPAPASPVHHQPARQPRGLLPPDEYDDAPIGHQSPGRFRLSDAVAAHGLPRFTICGTRRTPWRRRPR